MSIAQRTKKVTKEEQYTEKKPQEGLEALLIENGIRENLFNARIALAMLIYVILNFLLVVSQAVHSEKTPGLILYGLSFLLLLLPACYVLYGKGHVPYAREILITSITIVCFLLATYTIYGLWSILVVPILLTCRYLDRSFTRQTATACYICLLAGNVIAIYLAYRAGYYDVNTMNLHVPLTLNGDMSIAAELIRHGDVTLGMIARSQLLSMFITALAMLIPTAFAISYADKGRQMMQSAMELAEQQERAHNDQRYMEEVETKVTISQIQPHFLYNTLSAIMAIEGNPEETIDALGDFSRYLRENLNTLSTIGNIPIAQEIEHVKRYVKLEQLRFGDKLNVKYSLHDLDFSIPPLTIQMLAENAIKHGITKKMFGGNLWINTDETPTEHIVRVIDDGIGFDPLELPQDGKEHIGLENVRLRLERWNHGRLEINSEPGIGTTCILHLPKEGDMP